MSQPSADEMARVVCGLADELRFEFDPHDEEYTVYYDTYDMSRTEDELWRALWILERDVRVEHGNSWYQEFGRGDYHDVGNLRDAEGSETVSSSDLGYRPSGPHWMRKARKAVTGLFE